MVPVMLYARLLDQLNMYQIDELQCSMDTVMLCAGLMGHFIVYQIDGHQYCHSHVIVPECWLCHAMLILCRFYCKKQYKKKEKKI